MASTVRGGWDAATCRVRQFARAALPQCEQPARARGLALAVADVGWFNTENLFREIDREEVSLLLLKCHDYINGWRRGVYPWSSACRLRQSGPALVGAAVRAALPAG